jgi:hypothetical protein
VCDGVEVGADSVLLGLEEVEWDGVGVVGLDELEPFGVELLLLRVQERTFVVGGGFELIEDGADDIPHMTGLCCCEAVGVVGGSIRSSMRPVRMADLVQPFFLRRPEQVKCS